jgi:hypothetical protein
VSVLVFRELLGRERLGLGVSLEPGKEEGVGGVVEELVLRVATVLVHGLPNDGKVDQGVLEVVVVLVMSVGEHQKFDKLDELKLGLFGEGGE